MTFLWNRAATLSLSVLCGAFLLSPQGVESQGLGDGFMFGRPNATLILNLGYGVPTAGSDIFDEITRDFTLDKGDFHSIVFGGGLSFYLNDQLDLALEFSYSHSSTWSEYVDWVDQDDLPIEQETKFTRLPFTVSARYFLTERGRSVGNLSWIPKEWAPYVGAGGGRMYYTFNQIGDFIDSDDLSIFRSEYPSEGWAWVGHVFGGVQWALSPLWIVTAEGRYSLADADLDRQSYSLYEPIDLSGFQATIGFGIRF